MFPTVLYYKYFFVHICSHILQSGAFWNLGGSSLTHPYPNPYSNFTKYPLRHLLAQANVFPILTVSTVSVIEGPSEGRKYALWSHWCYKYCQIHQQKCFRHKTCGALSPQSFVRGGSYAPPAPHSAAYDTTFPKLYTTCDSITCSRLFVSFNFWYYNIKKLYK